MPTAWFPGALEVPQVSVCDTNGKSEQAQIPKSSPGDLCAESCALSSVEAPLYVWPGGLILSRRENLVLGVGSVSGGRHVAWRDGGAGFPC